MNKLTAKSFENEPLPRIILRDEKYRYIADCGSARSGEDVKIAAEIVKKFNAYPDLLDALKTTEHSLRYAGDLRHDQLVEIANSLKTALEAAEEKQPR
jgi:hypothetical protein